MGLNRIRFAVVLFFLISSAASAQTNQSVENISETKQVKSPYQFSYWSMFTGPAIGDSLDSTTDASGSEVDVGANYFQALVGSYSIDSDSSVGVQMRASNDLKSNGIDILNPRAFYSRKNVADNSVFNLGLQGFIEVPTTRVSKERTQLTSFLFAQNFSFKSPIKDLTLFLMTMTNANFYKDSSGKRSFELIAMPMITYQLSETFQFMSWAWFDRSDLNGWGDDYWRVGVNYFLLPNVQLYPCLQFFTDQIRADNTTLGLEIAAQF